MTFKSAILSLVLVAVPATAAAQSDPKCTPYSADTQAENLCNIAVDATRYFHPLLGLAITGGNPVVGSFRTLGGLGHLSVGVRATAFEFTPPDLDADGSSSTVAAGEDIPLGAPTVDVGVGLFNGLTNGLLSVDLLASIVALPNDIDDLTVDSTASTISNFSYKVGWGARVGIFRGAFPIPAVAVSYMKREFPSVRIGDVTAGDNFSYQTGLSSTAMRLTAGWRFGPLELGGGVGRDSYTGDAVIQFEHPTTLATETIELSLDNTRTTLFADVGLNLGPLKLAGEIGKQSNNDLQTASDFSAIDIHEGKTFASAGVRLAF